MGLVGILITDERSFNSTFYLGGVKSRIQPVCSYCENSQLEA